ncbi:hypothetical protein BDZ97DRAFT_1922074 [Flammula alnicola]|nr:hypothetical protein BDZ97DRAFT_1922074 [Flammula alnicola]
MSEDQTMTPTPSQEIDVEQLYSSVQPADVYTPSIASWLVPVLDKHRTRIITLSRNSERGRLSVEWPKQMTWMGMGLAGDQWLPRAEDFYKQRLSELRSGNLKLFKSSVWKEKLKLWRVATNRILDGSEH